MININDLLSKNTELFLFKLPKELVKSDDLEFKFKKLKDGNIITNNDKKYKVKIKEPQTAYSILLNKDNDKYVAENNFKSIIQLDCEYDIEEFKQPFIQKNKEIKEPEAIGAYLKNKKRKINDFNDDNIRNQINPELRIKTEPLDIELSSHSKHKKKKK